MKNSLLVLLLLGFLTVPIIAYATPNQWSDKETILATGVLGKVDIKLSTLEINLGVVTPNYSNKFEIEVVNTGTVKVSISDTIRDVPRYLHVSVEYQGDRELKPGETTTIWVIIEAKDIPDSEQDKVVKFEVDIVGS
jgi:hypothetical protein